MSKPEGLTRICVQGRPSNCLQRKLPNSIVVLFTLVELGFGFHFGFIKTTGVTKKAVKFMTILIGVVMSAILIVSVYSSSFRDFWAVIFTTQFTLTFLTLVCSKYSLQEFLCDLITMEECGKDIVVQKLGLIIWLYVSAMVIARITIFMVFYLYAAVTVNMINVASEIPMMGLDFIPVASFIVFYYMYAQMRNLKLEMERQEINAERLFGTYKKVADAFDKFRGTYDFIFFWGFLTDSSKWMYIIWSYLNSMKSSSSWMHLGCLFAGAIHITMQICAPTVCAEMINVEIDGLKEILDQRCLTEPDDAVAAEWAQVRRYMKTRPLLRKAWRLVPLDLRLPVSMLSLCVTYLIVIIQFTHLFD